MAEESDGEKTEEPSEHRIEEFRRRVMSPLLRAHISTCTGRLSFDIVSIACLYLRRNDRLYPMAVYTRYRQCFYRKIFENNYHSGHNGCHQVWGTCNVCRPLCWGSFSGCTSGIFIFTRNFRIRL